MSTSPASTATCRGVWCSGCSCCPPLQGAMQCRHAGSGGDDVMGPQGVGSCSGEFAMLHLKKRAQ